MIDPMEKFRIPGSRLYRNFCARCQEPMRVNYSEVNKEVFCEECEPKQPKLNASATKDEESPWGENAVRALEEDR